MSEELKERPSILKRRPRPAPDESVDPVDYTPNAPATAATVFAPAPIQDAAPTAKPSQQAAPDDWGMAITEAVQPATAPERVHYAPAARAAAPAQRAPRQPKKPAQPSRSARREVVYPLSTRVSQEVQDALYAAVDDEGISVREAVEQAIMMRWGSR